MSRNAQTHERRGRLRCGPLSAPCVASRRTRCIGERKGRPESPLLSQREQRRGKNNYQKPKGLAWWRRTQAAPALARSLLSFAWFQPRSKVDVDGAFFFTPYPVCAVAGRTARAALKLIATTRILVTFISRKAKLQILFLAMCVRGAPET